MTQPVIQEAADEEVNATDYTALSGGALLAQNLTGSWQGTLEAGPQKLRTVFKISLDDDKLKAVLWQVPLAPADAPAPR